MAVAVQYVQPASDRMKYPEQTKTSMSSFYVVPREVGNKYLERLSRGRLQKMRHSWRRAAP